MSGEDKHLGYLDMGRGVGCKDGNIGNVITRQWLDALVDIGGTLVVTMKADVAEVRLNKTGLQVGDTDGRVGHVDAESVRQRFHRSCAPPCQEPQGASS